jgi:hypothetical protein
MIQLSTAVKNSPPPILVKTPKVVEYARNGGMVNDKRSICIGFKHQGNIQKNWF